MSYPFCGCCSNSDNGRPAINCHPRCVVLQGVERKAREKKAIELEEINVDLDIAKNLAEKHGVIEVLSRFISG
jgi:hypothetical protein